jgi:putative oxidoreductase
MNKKVYTGARIILGLGFLIFGINGFLNFMPNPPMTAEAGALLGAFAKTGYFFPMIKIIETAVGVLLLANLFAPLAIVLISPILLGVTTIHLFLNPAGLPMMVLLHVLHGIVAYGFRDYYKSVLTKKSEVA